MARTVRTASPTGLYHVTSRAVRPMRLFLDASDCAAFRHSLALVHADDPWRLFAYCLMGTHFHLVVRAEPDALARAMRRVKGWYAHELNRRRGRSGPVFDGRYQAKPLATEEHAFAAIVYIAVNPVRAGLRSHPAEWPFSSHREHAGLEPRAAWLAPLSDLGLFASAEPYRDAVDAAVARIAAERRSDLTV